MLNNIYITITIDGTVEYPIATPDGVLCLACFEIVPFIMFNTFTGRCKFCEDS